GVDMETVQKAIDETNNITPVPIETPESTSSNSQTETGLSNDQKCQCVSETWQQKPGASKCDILGQKCTVKCSCGTDNKWHQVQGAPSCGITGQICGGVGQIPKATTPTPTIIQLGGSCG